MLKLAFNIAGVYICFLTWGYTQERVSSTVYGDGEKFKYFIFMNMVQAAIASVVGYCYSKYIKKDASLKMTRTRAISFMKVSLISCLASPFGYASLKYIDYLTMILAKSSKLIPVMVMHKLLYNRTFPLYKYAVVGCITTGVVGFMYFSSDSSKFKTKQTSPGLNLDSIFGLLLVFINLGLDGALNSTQDEIMKIDKKINGRSMMIYMNLCSAGLLLLYLLNPYGVELTGALNFLARNHAAIFDILLFSFCGAIGQCFIFNMLANYGSLTLVTVTVTRKLFTMLLSVFLYGKVLTSGQWISIATVFGAIIFEVVMKRVEKKKEYTQTKHVAKNPISQSLDEAHKTKTKVA